MIPTLCISFLMLNLSTDLWNKEDMVNLRAARLSCSKRNKCLYRFEKINKIKYYARCDSDSLIRATRELDRKRESPNE